MTLADRVKMHLPRARTDPAPKDSSGYHEGFRQSGTDKGKRVVEVLRRLGADPVRCAYVSVGGSYGSEIEYVMEHSAIRKGVLLEYDDRVIDQVFALRTKMAAQGKQLELVIGDANQKKGSVRSHLSPWFDNREVDTVVCSAQAVFHELPTRSPGSGAPT